MSPEKYAAIKRLFTAVAELPPGQQGAALAGLTDDPEVISEVLALHAVTADATHAWQPIAAALGAAATEPIAPGDTLGVWRIAAEIGRGGMAHVFLAERSDGHFEQRAALKVLQGMPSPQALTLFTRERQLLAHLSHPNIARLLDGGATSDRRPYLVMEHIAGHHIDVHCLRAGLAVDAILDLFLTACDAVAFAHRRLVIHCDIKPSNLLIEAGGRPVLLDFGIAHLLGRVEADPANPANPESPENPENPEIIAGRVAPQPAASNPDTPFAAAPNSLTAPRAFTPRYASPEQIERGALSTASDIYSLGVLLGELLAAAPDRQRLAALRRRELAAIVSRATRRDPSERYATVDALTADIRRFRNRRPITEWQGRRGYVVRKLVARRWTAVAAAVLVTATLAAVAAQAMVESHRARTAERGAQAAAAKAETDRNRATRAEAASRQTSDFLVSIFRASHAPGEVAPIPTATLIAQAEARLETDLAGQPAALSDIHSALGQVQLNLGNHPKAREHLLRAIAIERHLDRPLALAHLLENLTDVRDDAYDPASGEADAREALVLFERYGGAEGREAVAARDGLAAILHLTGKLEEAEALRRRNLAIFLPGGPSKDLADALDVLAGTVSKEGRHDEAIAILRRSQAMYLQLHGRDDADYIEAGQDLATVLDDARRFDEAVTELRAALAAEQRTQGADSFDTAWAMGLLALGLDWAGQPREAIPLYRQAIAIGLRRKGRSSAPVGILMHDLAMAENETGDEPAAKADWERSLAALGGSSSEASLAVIRVNYGMSLVRAGELEAARIQVEKGLAGRRASRGESSPDTLKARLVQAMWHLRKGDVARARAEIAGIQAQAREPMSWLGIEVVRQAALAEAALGHNAEAVAGLQRAEELEARFYGAGHLVCAFGKVPRAELLARGTAAQRTAGAALAAAILDRIAGELVPTAPLRARLERLAAAARPPRDSGQSGG